MNNMKDNIKKKIIVILHLIWGCDESMHAWSLWGPAQEKLTIFFFLMINYD